MRHPTPLPPLNQSSPPWLFLGSALVGAAAGAALFLAFPFPTTIPVFVSLCSALVVWTVGKWIALLWTVVVGRKRSTRRRTEQGYRVLPQDVDAEEKLSVSGDEQTTATTMTIIPRKTRGSWFVLGLATAVVVFLLCLGVTPPAPSIPATTAPIAMTAPNGNTTATVDGAERIFIAANLYNVVDIWETWSTQVLALIEHLGPERTYLSIYESNSGDATPQLLHAFADTLDSLHVAHRIVTDKTTTRHWPHGASEERIAYLAAARNSALEPLASSDRNVRLDDEQGWARGRVVFLNDVIFGWRNVVELLETRLEGGEQEDASRVDRVDGEGDYDLVCAVDFGWSGMYDTWVARDICGSPMRPFFPYVKDPLSISLMEQNKPLEVGSCWNGVVAFRAALVAWRGEDSGTVDGEEQVKAALVGQGTSSRKRGWQMVDNATDPQSRHSPPVQLPLSFRTSHLDACDHSECFLFSYDLHRIYPTKERPPRILMNPRVKVAYEKRWWVWHNVVLEIPVIKFWLDNWSRGYPLVFVDWIWESARRRDYCTWAGLSNHLPARCPALPGAVNRPWNQG